MLEIRKFEDKVHELFAQGVLPGFVHLYAGEEAVAVGVCAHLTDSDSITSTHRGHGHCIAKGCDLNGMMAELFGKATGLCKGKGGSMHIADLDKGMLGANGIVGGGFPLACGSALTAKYKGTKDVSVCFFGDGANNEGTFHEGVNLAAIWKLPVILSLKITVTVKQRHLNMLQVVILLRIVRELITFQVFKWMEKDLLAVYKAAEEAVEHARNGGGPTIIECMTYRNYGHFEGEAQTYKTSEEKEEHLNEKDAIVNFRKHLIHEALLTESELVDMEKAVDEAVQKSIEFSENSPYPEDEELLKDVYVSYK